MGKAWNKIVAVARMVLALQPVAVQGIIRATLVVVTGLLAVFGLEWDAGELEGRLVGLVTAVWLLSELIGAAWANRRTTATAVVVEAAARPPATSTTAVPVIAGPANDQAATGALVRFIPPGA